MKKVIIVLLFVILCLGIVINFLPNVSNNQLSDNSNTTNNTTAYEFTELATINGEQDGCIYNNYLFSFGANNIGYVYNMNTLSYISNFTLDKNNLISPHCNTAVFGTEKYSVNDEFPLLYLNIYNNDTNNAGCCCVYRVLRNNNTFTTQLVQIIKIGFTADANKWPSSNIRFGNFIVDNDRKDLWVYVLDSSNQSTKYFCFDLPLLSDGVYNSTFGCNYVTLAYADVKNEFVDNYYSIIQGGFYYNGKIYSIQGDNNILYDNVLNIVNLSNGVVKRINLTETLGFNYEPEMICLYNNKLYFKNVYKKLYCITGIV